MSETKGEDGPTLREYPAAIRATKTQLQGVRESLRNAHAYTKIAELDLYERVREGTTSDKKAEQLMPQFKQTDPDYQAVYCAELKLEREKTELEAELESLRGEFALSLLDRAEEVFAPIGNVLQMGNLLNMVTKDPTTE